MNRYLTKLAVEDRKWHLPVGVLSLLLGYFAIETWIEDSPADESFNTWLLAHLVVAGLMLLPLYFIVRWRLRQRSARIIAARLIRRKDESIPVEQLDGVLGIKGAGRKVEDLIKRGFLQRIELQDGELLLDNPVPDAPAREEEPAPGGVIGQIRRLNDEIDDEAVSERIDRIERVTASILQTIEERPDRADAARRFMNYYLPTTLKLLESYRLMEKQSYQGQNIQASRRNIEAVLDKLVEATEQQQDKLFGAEALDVEAEIRVLETMMTSDGLVDSGRMKLR